MNKTLVLDDGDTLEIPMPTGAIDMDIDDGKHLIQIYSPSLHCWTDKAYKDFLRGSIPRPVILDLGVLGFLKLWWRLKIRHGCLDN